MPTKLFVIIWIWHGVLMAGAAPDTTSRWPPPWVLSSGVSGQTVARAAPATLEGDLFERTRGSVFVVETESGHGSGFLVDDRGLIATNDHVVRDTEYLAVAVEPRRKYPAVVVARDRLHDVAILRIHPRALDGLQPLKLTDPQTPVRIGERILAIGSALTDDASVLTVGMVSRVAAETIVADLNVNPGSSGGPVLNMNGDVIGISTYIVRAAAGPGLAGIVRAQAVPPVLSNAVASLDDAPPPFEQLPVASRVPYPPDALRKRVAALRNTAAYAAKPGRLRIDVLTPPVVYYEAHVAGIRDAAREPRHDRQHAREAEPHEGANEYLWHAHAARLEAMVGVRITADMGGSANAAPQRDADSAAPIPPRTTARTGLSSDFRRMRLFRNGVEVMPIVPGRFCRRPIQSATDREPAGCIGLYQYPPEAFVPGASLELHVYSADPRARARVWVLPSELVDLVWSDFEPWRTIVARFNQSLVESRGRRHLQLHLGADDGDGTWRENSAAREAALRPQRAHARYRRRAATSSDVTVRKGSLP